MALPKRQPAGKPLPSRPGPPPDAEETEQQEQTQQRPSSRADAFNNAEPETGLSIPVGNYTAHLVGAERTIDGQKEAVKVDYEIAEGDQEGKTVPTWYNLFNKDGEPQRGTGFLKRDMEMLGQPPLDYDKLDDQLEALANERLLCNITVKKNGQYTNIYFQGLAEGE